MDMGRTLLDTRCAGVANMLGQDLLPGMWIMGRTPALPGPSVPILEILMGSQMITMRTYPYPLPLYTSTPYGYTHWSIPFHDHVHVGIYAHMHVPSMVCPVCTTP